MWWKGNEKGFEVYGGWALPPQPAVRGSDHVQGVDRENIQALQICCNGHVPLEQWTSQILTPVLQPGC